MPALQPQQETITLEQYEALPEEKSLKQLSRGQPKNKGHSKQTIYTGGFKN